MTLLTLQLKQIKSRQVNFYKASLLPITILPSINVKMSHWICFHNQIGRFIS